MKRQDRISEFFARYDDQWDYTHQQLYWWYGGLYAMYRRKKGLKITEDGKPEHLKDVPDDEYDEYFEFLKKELADFWCVSVSEVEQTYTIEDALCEYVDAFDDVREA